jgi:hypothetical protein
MRAARWKQMPAAALLGDLEGDLALRVAGGERVQCGGRLRTIPADDAIERVIQVLEQQPRGTPVSTGDAMRSVRIAAAGPERYVVTSAVGNFSLGREDGYGWLSCCRATNRVTRDSVVFSRCPYRRSTACRLHRPPGDCDRPT